MTAPAAAAQERPKTKEQQQALAMKVQVDTVRTALEALKPQIAMALPLHISADRMCRIVMTQVQRTPKLLQCERTSLYAAVVTAAALGLEPDGIVGHLVP